MIESAARAERAEARSSTAPYYVWEPPQGPVVVRISLDVVDRLGHEVVESFRSVSHRGSEIGGLLLGRNIPGARPAVAIEEFELIPCDYSRGPLYRLADADKQRFDAAIERHAAGRGLAVVGFFRSNTRRSLALEAEDAVFLTERFHDPRQVALLVRPFATKGSVAGMFVWEDGAVRGDASALEFPFDRADMAARGLIQSLPAGGEPAATPAPAEPKPAPRAQVVPIASRREIPIPPPAAAPAPAPQTPPPPPPPEPAAAPAPIEEAAQPPEDVEALPGSRFGGKVLWISAGAAVLLLLLVTMFVYPGLLTRRGQAPSATDTSGLALRVERSAGQLLLTWNREHPMIKNARKAVLSISDGTQQENVALDLAALRNGSIVYSPVTNDVSFRLEVTGANQGKTQSEYVRVLGTRPSPMPPAGEQAAGQTDAKAAEGTPGAPTEPAAANSTARRRFVAPPVESLAGRLRPAAPADLTEAPAPEGVAVPNLHTSVAVPAAGLPAAPAAPGPPPAAGPTAPAPAAARQAPPPTESSRVGGRIQEARLVYRREPVYPMVARQARIQGTVVLDATVGKDGKVRNVKVVSGPGMLRQAAADAVKAWVYSPTLLNGEAVENVTRVQVGFTINGR